MVMASIHATFSKLVSKSILVWLSDCLLPLHTMSLSSLQSLFSTSPEFVSLIHLWLLEPSMLECKVEYISCSIIRFLFAFYLPSVIFNVLKFFPWTSYFLLPNLRMMNYLPLQHLWISLLVLGIPAFHYRLLLMNNHIVVHCWGRCKAHRHN